MTVRLMLEARDALGADVTIKTKFAVTLNGSNKSITTQQANGGLVLSDGDELRVTAKRRGKHTVEQSLKVDGTKLSFSGDRDNHAQLVQHGLVGGEARFSLVMWMTLFRKRTFAELGWPHGAGSHDKELIDIAGEYVLNNGGTGLGRIDHRSVTTVTQHDPSYGSVRFFETTKSAKEPQLVALYIPAGLRHDKPIPISTFCLPTPAPRRNYPRGRYYHDRIEWYLTWSYGLLQQNAWRKKVCLAFPMPHSFPKNKPRYFSAVQSAAKLRRFLQELVFELHAHGHVGSPLPKLGRCAISGFSRGGSMVGSVVRTSLTPHNPSKGMHNEFPELKEAWSLDGEEASARSVNKRAKAWLKAVPDRRLRLYVAEYESMKTLKPTYLSGQPRRNGPAHEWASAKGTFLFAPKEFWMLIYAEEKAAGRDPIVGDEVMTKEDAHLVIPKLMMTHALSRSGY